jgi:small multidrug resistance pump
MAWLYLVFAILSEVVGTTALKYSDGFTRIGPSAVTLVAYALSFVLLAQVLRVIPVGVAYAIWSGTGVALITLIGWTVLGQKLDAVAMGGIGLIVAGVIVLNVWSGHG